MANSVSTLTTGVAQSVFDHGQLLAIHMYEQTKEGVGGSASARIAVDHEVVRQRVERIGTHLTWHGSLMIDYLYDGTSNEVAYIEANPRPGETMNTTLSCVNLIEILVKVAIGQRQVPRSNGRIGTLSHSGIAVLPLVSSGHSAEGERDLIKECCAGAYVVSPEGSSWRF